MKITKIFYVTFILFLDVLVVVLHHKFFSSAKNLQLQHPNYGNELWIAKNIILGLLPFMNLWMFYTFYKKQSIFPNTSHSILNSYRDNKVFRLFNSISFKTIRVSIFMMILLIAIYLRFGTGDILFFDGDSMGYIDPALQLKDKGEISWMGRSYPYPFFLYGVLSLFNHISAILWIQHILAIITLIFLVFFIERRLLPSYPTLKSAVVTFSLSICVLVFCFWNGNLIAFEKTVRPEGVILPSSFLLMFLIWIYFSSRKKNDLHSFLIPIIVLISFLYGLLHPRNILGIYVVLIYILGNYFLYTNYNRTKKVTIGIVSLIIAILVIYPEKEIEKKAENIQLKEFAYRHFFYSNMRAVKRAIHDKLHVIPGLDTVYLKKMSEEVFDTAPDYNGFPILGYNLDNPQYEFLYNYKIQYELANWNIDSIIKARTQIAKKEKRALNKNDTLIIEARLKGFHEFEHQFQTYYSRWFRLLCLNYPIEILKKTSNQFFFFFLSPKTKYINSVNRLGQEQRFTNASREFDYIKSLGYQPDEPFVMNYPRRLEHIMQNIGLLLKYVFTLTSLLFIYNIFRKRLSSFEWSIGLILFLSIFTIGFTHNFDYSRYAEALLPFILVFTILGIQKLYMNNKGNSPYE